MHAYMTLETKELQKTFDKSAQALKKQLRKPLNKAANRLLKEVKKEGKAAVKKGDGKKVVEQVYKATLKYKLGYQVYIRMYIAGWLNLGTKQRFAGGGRMRTYTQLKNVVRKLGKSSSHILTMGGSLKKRGLIKALRFFQKALDKISNEIVGDIQRSKNELNL